MPTLTITLSDEELAGLTDYANRERRTPAAQAAYLVAAFIESLQEDQQEPFLPFASVPIFTAPSPHASEAFVYQETESAPEPQRETSVMLDPEAYPQRAPVTVRDRSANEDMPPRGRAFQINR